MSAACKACQQLVKHDDGDPAGKLGHVTFDHTSPSARRGIMLKAGRKAEEQGDMREDAQ
jgi:hypothetical protein